MLSMKEIIALWLLSKEKTVKVSTREQYKRTVKKVLVGMGQIGRIDELTVEKQVELVDLCTKRYNVKSLKNVNTVLNQFLLFAFENGYTSKEIKLHIKPPVQKKSNIQILNSEEQKKLTQYLMHELDFSKLGILLTLYTGLRLGEICSLKWSDLDFENQTVSINKTIQRISNGSGATYFLVGSPKTQFSERIIPIPSFLVKYIRSMRQASDKDAYLATGTTGFVQPRTYQNRFKSYCRKCGITEYHFHTLRHTFASRAVELGVNIKALSEILGHSSTKITLDMYVHPTMEHKRKELQKFSAFVK